MWIGCRSCPRRAECRELCDGARAYVDQDAKASRREPLLGDLFRRPDEVVGEGILGSLSAELWGGGAAAFRVDGREIDANAARAALGRLTTVERRRARQRWMRGRSETEIAAREGVSVVAVNQSLARCVEKITASLARPVRGPGRPPREKPARVAVVAAAVSGEF